MTEEKMQNRSYFDNILTKILELPLWVKQALFVELKEHMIKIAPLSSIDVISKNNLIQLYVPLLTQFGTKVQANMSVGFGLDKSKLDKEIVEIIDLAKNKQRIIDICQAKNWTLSQTSKILCKAIEQNLIEQIKSNIVESTVYFLAGKIRIGEYLVRTGKITVEQLNMALYSQKYTEDTIGERIFLAQILLNLHYITSHDYENLIFLKEYGDELYPSTLSDNIKDVNEQFDNLYKEIESLRQERYRLRDNISRFAEDAQTIASLLTRIDSMKKRVDIVEKENVHAKKNVEQYLKQITELQMENDDLRSRLNL